MTRRTCTRSGVSIIETLIASVILAIAVTSLYALYGQSLRALRYANESASAQLYFRSQVDLLRNCTWSVLSGTGYGSNFQLPDSILPDSSTEPNLKFLPSPTQKLTVYSTTTGSSYWSISRSSGGSRGKPFSAISSSILSERALTFLFNLTWTGQNGNFTREYSAEITNPNQ